MKQETRQFINDLATEIRVENAITVPIDNMRDVVTILGGIVETIDPFSEDSYFDGTIRKNDENSFLIRIDPFQGPERENFTIAHELGHLFLHMGYQVLPELWDEQDDTEFARFGRNEQEYQAHEFAAAFLMPEEEYREAINNNIEDDGRINIKNVAEYFRVSVPAATNRGKFLGVIEW